MSLPGRQGKEERCPRVVTLDATAIGIHPAEVELRLRITQPGALAIERDRARVIPRHPLAMLVRQRLLAQRQATLGFGLLRDAPGSGGKGWHGKAQQTAEKDRAVAHQGRTAKTGSFHQ
ncbi:MAG: hypothetical protein AW07_02929 [Candidatus Accumulibacter sp. SK-11]|nr:MAG: hypothetical protein AW07_02929 [Candidatus Accumulibacter sp. SK-11]